MSRKNALHVISALAVVFLGSGMSPVRACECIGTSTPNRSLARAASVFTGYVVGVTLGSKWDSVNAARPRDCGLEITQEGAGTSLCLSEEVVVTFEVIAAWKGFTSGKVQVRTPAQGTACGFAFRVGQSYLVYADARTQGGGLTTDTCHRTKATAEAQADLQELGPPSVNPFLVEPQHGEKRK